MVPLFVVCECKVRLFACNMQILRLLFSIFFQIALMASQTKTRRPSFGRSSLIVFCRESKLSMRFAVDATAAHNMFPCREASAAAAVENVDYVVVVCLVEGYEY